MKYDSLVCSLNWLKENVKIGDVVENISYSDTIKLKKFLCELNPTIELGCYRGDKFRQTICVFGCEDSIPRDENW